MIILKIIMNALPEKRKEVLQTLVSMIAAIRQEKGCRSCQGFQDIEDESVFSLIGEWETHEDLEHHIRSDRFGVLLGSNFLLNENHEIQIHTVSHTEGSEIVNAVRGKII
jgi:quinol monooxygenase YgiN